MPYADPEMRREMRRRYKAKAGAAQQRRRYHALRTQAIEALGGKCARCGSTDRLEIDHIDGGGKVDRKARGQLAIYRAIAAGEPGFQVLCNPHHWDKTREDRRASTS